MPESMTIFRGVVDDIGQIIGYMQLANYYDAPSLALNISSQGGEIYILLERETKGFKISSAYFNDPKNLKESELNEHLVYSELKKICKQNPIAIKGIKNPSGGKITVPLNIPNYSGFVMELCRRIDTDTREIPIASELEEKTNESEQEN